MAATERVPVLMTPAEKKRLVSKAKRAGLTTGEFMRRAAEGFNPSDDGVALGVMIDQMNQATERAERIIDEVLSFVEESNQRIAEMEKSSGAV